MTQRILITIDVPDGVSVQVQQDGRAAPIAPFQPIGTAAAQVPTDICPIHHTEWKGEAGDLYHKDGEKWCRHPNNIPKARK